LLETPAQKIILLLREI